MNLLQDEAKALFEGIKNFTKDFTAPQLPTIVIAPVFTSLNVVHTEKCNCGCGGDKIAIAGLGGLGSNIAIGLARIGVGQLHLVDFDRVDLSNLNRQQYFLRHLGMEKTEAMTELLREVNPYLDVRAVCCRVTEENICRYHIPPRPSTHTWALDRRSMASPPRSMRVRRKRSSMLYPP